MAGFVKGMIPAVQSFVAERRQRCGPTEEDPASFGRRVLAPAAPLDLAPRSPAAAPGLPRCGSLASCGPVSASASFCDLTAAAGCARTASDASLACDSASLAGSDRSVRSEGAVPRNSSMRRLGAMMLASGVAIALARTASTGSLPPPSPSGRAGGSASRSQAHGKRHGPAGSGSRHHGQRRHASHGARGSDAPPRPRRQQQPAPVDA